jgi:hypothetical protein
LLPAAESAQSVILGSDRPVNMRRDYRHANDFVIEFKSAAMTRQKSLFGSLFLFASLFTPRF